MEYTFTKEQFDLYTQYILDAEQYKSTDQTPPEYEEWLKETFGHKWFNDKWEEHHDQQEFFWENQFSNDFWYGYVTGHFSEEIVLWVEDEKKDYKNFLKSLDT